MVLIDGQRNSTQAETHTLLLSVDENALFWKSLVAKETVLRQKHVLYYYCL